MRKISHNRIDPTQSSDWNKRLLSINESSIFHSREWANVLVKSFGYIPYYFVNGNNGDRIDLFPFMETRTIGGKKKAVSLPFSDCIDPIHSDNKIEKEDFLNSLIEFARNKKWKSIDFHGYQHLFCEERPYKRFLGHTLKIDNQTQLLFKKLNSNTKRNIKKAKKNGVRIEISNDFEKFYDFYHLHCITRKKHQLPPQPKQFFKNIYNEIINNGLGNIFYAIYNEKIVASIIFFHFGTNAIYKFGESNEKYNFTRANQLLMWNAIKYYAENGFREISFGRTDSENLGLQRYKRSWGTKEYEINYYCYDLNANEFISSGNDNFYKIINFVFGKMPIGISKLLAIPLYKYFG